MMNTEKTFVLADNQDITRAGLHSYISDLFGKASRIDVQNKKELLHTLSELRGGCIVLLDYTLFDLNGAEDLLIISRRFPHVQWVLFSAELSEEFIRRASVEKHIGMILKESSGEEIRSALLCAARGERFLGHQITDLLLNGYHPHADHARLTGTEKEILRLIARGMSVKEIATERISSIHTIATHKKNIFRKLEVNNVYEATKYALRAGLVEMAEYYI